MRLYWQCDVDTRISLTRPLSWGYAESKQRRFMHRDVSSNSRWRLSCISEVSPCPSLNVAANTCLGGPSFVRTTPCRCLLRLWPSTGSRDGGAWLSCRVARYASQTGGRGAANEAG